MYNVYWNSHFVGSMCVLNTVEMSTWTASTKGERRFMSYVSQCLTSSNVDSHRTNSLLKNYVYTTYIFIITWPKNHAMSENHILK